MVGDRIRLAREFVEMSQKDLAALLGLQQATVAYLESGRHRASEAVIAGAAKATGFPAMFFQDIPLDAFPEGSLVFRRRKRTSAAEVRRAYTTARLGWEFTRSLLSQVKPWPMRLPIMNEEDPIAAAAVTRSAFGLSPDEPLINLTGKIEMLGVPVLEIDRELNDLDGFSLWAGLPSPRPIIGVNAQCSGDRQRWTLAHELGHLVLHGAIRGSVDDVEKQADAFAAELLLPESGIRGEFVRPVTISQVCELKGRWRVSLAGLIRRAHELELVSDRRKTDLFVQLGKQGWRKVEPIPIAPERAQTLIQLMAAVHGRSANLAEILQQEHLPPDLAAALGMERGRLRVVRSNDKPPTVGPQSRANV